MIMKIQIKIIKQICKKEEKEVEILKTRKTNSNMKKEKKMEKNAVEILKDIKNEKFLI